MLVPLLAARVRFGPTLFKIRYPTVGTNRMKCRNSMMGCFANTTSSKPNAAPAAMRRAVHPASNQQYASAQPGLTPQPAAAAAQQPDAAAAVGVAQPHHRAV